MRRNAIAALVLLAACSGGAGGAGSWFPAGPAHDLRKADSAKHPARRARAAVTMTIPAPPHHRRSNARDTLHPNTISPFTKSVVFSVDSREPQSFDTTRTSPNCSPLSGGGVRCAFMVAVDTGQTDTIVVTTYSEKAGRGYALDQGFLQEYVPPNPTNGLTIHLGPVVSSTKDSGPGTLRQAVANADPGDVIYSVLHDAATIVLKKPIALTKDVYIAGPGTALLAIDGNNATQLFTVASGVQAGIGGVLLTGGSAIQGGAIASAGILGLYDDELDANGGSKAKLGGAVYADANSTLYVYDTTFSNNRTLAGGDGGAIYGETGSTMDITGDTFTANLAGAGGAIFASNTVTIYQSTFKNNGTPSTTSGGDGGALYAAGTTYVSQSQFQGNFVGGNVTNSNGSGGAVYLKRGNLVVTNTSFVGNAAGGGSGNSFGYGGAIDVVTSTDPVSVAYCDFSANSAGGQTVGQGGAIYSGSPLWVTYSTLENNVANGLSATDGYALGGAIAAFKTLTIQDSQFNSNTAVGGGQAETDGGAVYAYGAANLSTALFQSNQVKATGGGVAAGGAAFFNAGAVTIGGSTFDGNVAAAQGTGGKARGGAIAASATLAVTTTPFTNNAATATSGAKIGEGGAIWNGLNLSLDNRLATNAAASRGGAIYNAGTLTVTGATIASNQVAGVSSNDGGAGIYNTSKVRMTGTTISGNTVTGTATNVGGGGIANAGTGSFVALNDTVAANSAANTGGGILNFAAGGLALTNVTIDGNSAAGKGGNIRNAGASAAMSLTNSIVAAGSGGSGADVYNDGTVTSGDYNIVQTAPAGNAFSGTTTHNLTADPLLGALADNGGPSYTLADTQSSPGWDAIPLSRCTGAGVTVDQRGFTRGAFGTSLCDVGAFELQP